MGGVCVYKVKHEVTKLHYWRNMSNLNKKKFVDPIWSPLGSQGGQLKDLCSDFLRSTYYFILVNIPISTLVKRLSRYQAYVKYVHKYQKYNFFFPLINKSVLDSPFKLVTNMSSLKNNVALNV